MAKAAVGDREHKNALEFRFLRDFLLSQPPENRDFLVLSNMYPHWKLRQPRHGFPHAANIDHIAAKSWWKDVVVSDPLEIPLDFAALCEKLVLDGPRVVAEWQSQSLYDCLNAPRSGYVVAADLLLQKNERFVILFRSSHVTPVVSQEP